MQGGQRVANTADLCIQKSELDALQVQIVMTMEKIQELRRAESDIMESTDLTPIQREKEIEKISDQRASNSLRITEVGEAVRATQTRSLSFLEAHRANKV